LPDFAHTQIPFSLIVGADDELYEDFHVLSEHSEFNGLGQ
jgi:hypothetical protein